MLIASSKRRKENETDGERRRESIEVLVGKKKKESQMSRKSKFPGTFSHRCPPVIRLVLVDVRAITA